MCPFDLLGLSLPSRRDLLRRLPIQTAAILGATILHESPLAAQTSRDGAAPRGEGAHLYNVRDFGAKGDGRTLDTRALQAAIDACALASGGTVLIPAGTFVIGTVQLKSNITLHLAAAARLLGSGDGKQYRAVSAVPLTGDATLPDGNHALIFAVHAHNITIEGSGTIDGSGRDFYAAPGSIASSGLGDLERPYHLLFYQCEHFVIREIALVDCAYHSIRIIQSKMVRLTGLFIQNRVNQNNDGFHFISCEHVLMSDCTVLSQDDACALFGSCRFICITNCTFSTRWSVFRFGGGSARNITVSNCVLFEVFGRPIKFQGNAGSRFENISFSNIVCQDVTGPIHISVGPKASHDPSFNQQELDPGLEPEKLADADQPSVARNISFTNLRGNVINTPRTLPGSNVPVDAYPGEHHQCITLNRVGNALLDEISFSDISLTFEGGGTAKHAARTDLPQIAGEYFMLGPMPCYGFYARGVHGLSLTNVRLLVATPDHRPALILDHVRDATINGLSIQGSMESALAMRFMNTSDVLVTAARILTPVPVFLEAMGIECRAIRVDGGDLSKATRAIACTRGAAEDAIKLHD